MVIKFKKIELTGFRGALHTVPLNFPNKGEGSTFLYGEGGTGKTTFAEAIEWFYKDKIESLEKEFCGKECYFNLRLDVAQNAIVAVEFTKPELNNVKTLSRRGPNTYSNRISEFNTYMQESLKENFLLQYGDLKEFVDNKTKVQKLDHFAKLIGFGKVTETRNIFLQVFNALKDSKEINEISGQLKEAKRFLTEKLGGEVITEEIILSYTMRQLKLIKPELKIEGLSEIPSIVKQLNDLADTSEISKRKHILETIKDQLDKSESIWSKPATEIIDAVKEYKAYLLDAEIIQKESLLKLYSIGKQILLSAEWADKEICPLCGNTVESKVLIKHLSEEIMKIESTLEKKKTLNTKFESIDTNITNAIATLKSDIIAISENKNKEKIIEDSKSNLLPLLNKLTSLYQDIQREVKDNFKNLSDISYDFNPIHTLVKELNSVYNEIKTIVQKEIESLVVGSEIQKYRNIARLLDDLLQYFKRSMELSLKIEKINKQVDSLKAIQEEFERKEKEVFKRIIFLLSKDINTFYSILNPDEGVDEIMLFPTEDKGADRGLEIAYKFHGSEQYPAKKYLSESHRSSLGISIFLASAKYFNKVNKFLILDDIYTSLDVNHRERLVNIFTHPSLSDRQFLITTHDWTWFKTMQRTLQSDHRWKFFEIRRWRIDTGIEIAEAPESIKKRIIDYLDKGDAFAACKSIRSYHEEALKRIAKRLEIRVPYKEAANWTADEFYSGIGERVKGSTIATDNRYTAGNPIGFLANLAAHENDINITSGTVKSLVEQIDNFEKAFSCDNCKKDIWYANRKNGGFQCQCGQLNCG